MLELSPMPCSPSIVPAVLRRFKFWTLGGCFGFFSSGAQCRQYRHSRAASVPLAREEPLFRHPKGPWAALARQPPRKCRSALLDTAL